MNGLELARGYYEAYGAPMLHEQFPALEGLIAVGLAGAGSECFGYDDEVSRDHDFEPGFCLFLPGEDVIDRKREFLLERAYARLPREYGGAARLRVQPVGGSRHGVLRMDRFFRDRLGAETLVSAAGWLAVPEQALAEATNGEIFRDDAGEFTARRAALRYLPEEVRLKKLAGRLLSMAQSGQYNYARCLAHGETGAAQLAMGEFVNHAMAAVFLLNRRYLPFYKWRFRALRTLPRLSELAEALETLLTTPNQGAQAEDKALLAEAVASLIIEELHSQSLTDAVCGDLEKHAYSVNDKIRDGALRNLHILCAV